MNKLVSIIVGSALGLTLAASVGIGMAVGRETGFEAAKAADVIEYTLDGTITGGNSGHAAISSINQGGIGWSVVADTTVSPWGVGTDKKGQVTGADRHINTNDALSPYNITKVVVTIGDGKNITINSFKMNVGTSAQGSDVSSISKNFDFNTTFTFDRPSGVDWSNKCFDFVFNITVEDGPARTFGFVKAQFYRDDSEAILQSISLDGHLSNPTFVYGDQWHHDGVNVIGHYSDNTTKIISGGITWTYSPAVALLDVHQLTITATMGNSSVSTTESVSVHKVGSPCVNDKAYEMSILVSTTTKYYCGRVSGNYGETDSQAKSAKVYFQSHDDGQDMFTYSNNQVGGTKNYIVPTVSSGSAAFSTTTTRPSGAWYYNGRNFAYYLSALNNCYSPGGIGSDGRIYMYESYISTNVNPSYALVSGLTAEEFATDFLNTITCDATGATAPTYSNNFSWNDFSALFDQVQTEEKTILIQASANENGTIVEQAMAKYDYIVAKYSYNNFINRSISNSANRMMGVIDNNQVIMMTVIFGLVISTAFVAFYALKKRKLD